MSQITPKRQETFGEKVLGFIILIIVCIAVLALAALVFDPVGGNAGSGGCDRSCHEDRFPPPVVQDPGR